MAEKANTEAVAKKTQEKKPATKKRAKAAPVAEAKTDAAEQNVAEKAQNPAVKSAVLTGANPDIKFYRISDDLPVHLL